MSPSLQLSIRPGQSTDVPAVLALLQGAGLPTGDLTSAKGLKMWVLKARDSLLGVIVLELVYVQSTHRALSPPSSSVP
jgi:hypothetical protein